MFSFHTRLNKLWKGEKSLLGAGQDNTLWICEKIPGHLKRELLKALHFDKLSAKKWAVKEMLSKENIQVKKIVEANKIVFW